MNTQDFNHAVEQAIYQAKQSYVTLKKKPGFVFSVVTTMGLSLGALLCVLTLAYVMFYKPLPYPDQDKLYVIEHIISDGKEEVNKAAYTYPGLLHLYKKQEVFNDLSLIFYGESIFNSSLKQSKITSTFVTPNWFTLLQVPMALGRYFSEDEGLNSHQPVAVLSYAMWQTIFDENDNVLDKKISLNGISHRIIGVTSRQFIEPELSTLGKKSKVFLPWDFNSIDQFTRTSWQNINDNLMLIGKLSHANTETGSISSEQINQSLSTLVNDNWQKKVSSEPFFYGWSITIKIRSLKSVILSDSGNTVYLLFAGVLGLVLITCTNVINLFIARVAEKQHHLAIYSALGASKQHIFKGLLAESVLLMLLSTLIALGTTTIGFWLLQENVSQALPRISEVTLNGFTLIMAIIISGGLSIILAFFANRTVNYHKLILSLQSSGKGLNAQITTKTRKRLILVQIYVVTLIIFVNISLFNQTQSVINQTLGFSTKQVLQLSLTYANYQDLSFDTRKELMLSVKNELSALPQVSQVSQSHSPLNDFSSWGFSVKGESRHHTPDGIAVDANYFELLNQPLLEGNYFNKIDMEKGTSFIIVNDVFAKILAPNGSVIGMQADTGDGIYLTIVGVVKGVLLPNTTNIPMRVYLSSSSLNRNLLVKLSDNQQLSEAQVSNILTQVDSQFSIFTLKSLDERRDQILANQYMTSMITLVLIVLTLLLSTIGLYGILSYSTQMRRFEIGTRLAIGAKRSNIILLVIKDNADAIVMGFIGSIASLVILSLVFGEQLKNYLNWQLLPLFLLTLSLISLISFIACYLPLRQYINKPAIYSLRGSD